MTFLQTDILDNSLIQWFSVVAIVILIGLAAWLIQRVVIKRLRRISERTKFQADDLVVNMLDNTKNLLVILVALYIGSQLLVLPDKVSSILRTVAVIALLAQAALWASQVINYILVNYVRDRAKDEVSGATAYTALSFISRLALWVLVGLLVLDNIGVEISSLITGLGITGVAVALAVQNILGDLFSSLTIVLDKPFVIGDTIVVGEFTGTVEHIGLKTTRLRSLNGEELVFANTDLLQSRIRNFKKMDERRGVFTVGVSYNTPQDKVEQIPLIIQAIVEAQEGLRFQRAHLKTLGPSTLDYEVVYTLLNPDFTFYMDAQQAIYFDLLQRFAEEQIEMPYPTQSLLVDLSKH
nr:mechanosensitive ion channel family protein [Anaerolineae bacterium]